MALLDNLRKTAGFAAVLATLASPLARASVEATQLDYVALDTSIHCDRLFFRSSDHFKGTIFMMPKVQIGAGPEGRSAYDISPSTDPKIFILSLRLFFPESDEDLRDKGASSIRLNTSTCNTDAVKRAINANETSDDQKVKVVSRMPLTSIEVAIPGVRTVGRIGRAADPSDTKPELVDGKTSEVDILDYNAKVLTATFQISAEEKNYFLSRVVDSDGLSVNVKFRFQARSRDGSIRATVDSKIMQAAVSAAAKGKASIAKFALNAAIRTSFDSKSISIVSDAGRSDASQKVAAQVIDKILKEVSFAIEALPAAPGSTASDSDMEVSVAAALDILAAKANRTIQFEQMSAPESATAQTPATLHVTSLRDPDVQEFIVKSGYQEPSTGMSLNKGDTMGITAASWAIDRIDYKSVPTGYLTTGQISDFNLATSFPTLTDRNVKISDDTVNGTTMAIGKQASWFGNYPGEYRWIRMQTRSTRVRLNSAIVPPTQDAFVGLPLALSFGALGGRYLVSFKNLFVPNKYWSATFDESTGRLLLTAKRNLGLVQFRGLMRSPVNELQMDVKTLDPAQLPDLMHGKSLVVDSVVQQYLSPVRSTQWSPPATITTDEHPIVLQRLIRLSVTRPSAFDDTESDDEPQPSHSTPPRLGHSTPMPLPQSETQPQADQIQKP